MFWQDQEAPAPPAGGTDGQAGNSAEIDGSAAADGPGRSSRAESEQSRGVSRPAAGGKREKFFLWIYGISGMGKTVYMRQLFQLRAQHTPAVFVDTNATNGELGTVVRNVDQLRAQLAARPYRSGAYVFQPGWGEKVADLWPFLYELGWCFVAVDEAQTYGAADQLDRNFQQLVQRGRNRCVDIASTCQSPYELAPRIRQNFDGVISFRQGTPAYAETMARDYFRSPQLARKLLELPRFHYLRATVDGRVSAGRVRIR